VTSGGIRCSKGTAIIKKPSPSLLSKEEQRKKKKKTEVLPYLLTYLLMELSAS
jgi:hypothetical protein